MFTELWQCDHKAFCERGDILVNSSMGNAIHALTLEKLVSLSDICDPKEDYLIHVDQDGFTVNHGNVGSKGIRYDFNR